MSAHTAENDAWDCDHHPEWADNRNVCHHPAHTAENDAPARCRWGAAGLPACRAGTRGTRWWCAACAPSLDPRVIPPGSTGDPTAYRPKNEISDRWYPR